MFNQAGFFYPMVGCPQFTNRGGTHLSTHLTANPSPFWGYPQNQQSLASLHVILYKRTQIVCVLVTQPIWEWSSPTCLCFIPTWFQRIEYLHRTSGNHLFLKRQTHETMCFPFRYLQISSDIFVPCQFSLTQSGWWWLEHEFHFSHHIGNVIIPTDEFSIIFQRGRSTTNQISLSSNII